MRHQYIAIFPTRKAAQAWIYDCMATCSGAQMHRYSFTRQGAWWVINHNGSMLVHGEY